jgi:putative SOS response-associated peptidase YedK
MPRFERENFRRNIELDPKGGRRPINAKAESIARLPMFREAYAQRRCIVPVDGFFEWRAIKGARSSSPTPSP